VVRSHSYFVVQRKMRKGPMFTARVVQVLLLTCWATMAFQRTSAPARLQSAARRRPALGITTTLHSPLFGPKRFPDGGRSISNYRSRFSLLQASSRFPDGGSSSSSISNYRSRFSLLQASTGGTSTEDDSNSTEESSASSSDSSALDRVYRQFLRSFWKGMAMPFPQLRNVILPRSLKAIRGRKGDSSSFTVGLSFREGLFALAAYLTSGVLAYHWVLEKWSIIDALYFTCVCFTTVGYGTCRMFCFQCV